MSGPSVDLLAVDVAPIVAFLGDRVTKVLAKALTADSLTSLAGVVVVFGLELAVLGYGRSSLRRLVHPTKSTIGDVVFYLVKIFGLQYRIVALCSLGLSVLAIDFATKHVDLQALTRVENSTLRIALFVVLTDFVSYWTHRGRHWFGWWWELHKYHHSAEELNAITTTRGHPLDVAAITITNAVPIALLGGSMGDSLLLLTPFAIHAGLTHSMLPWRWGWFGRYVVFSPTAHRVHHSPLAEHQDKNFGALLPVWDWLFGTLYTGDVLNEVVGVDGNYHNRRGFLYDMVETTRRSFRAALRLDRAAG